MISTTIFKFFTWYTAISQRFVAVLANTNGFALIVVHTDFIVVAIRSFATIAGGAVVRRYSSRGGNSTRMCFLGDHPNIEGHLPHCAHIAVNVDVFFLKKGGNVHSSRCA